jgi:signal transduction histidine kinase
MEALNQADSAASLDALLCRLEEDRGAVAEALRAGTGQVLATVLVGVRALESSKSVGEIRTEARDLREVIRTELQNVLALANRIVPSVLKDVGLQAALEQVAGQLMPSGPVIAVEFDPSNTDLAMRDRVLVFRILEDAMRDAAFHRLAQRITLRRIGSQSRLKFEMTDDGHGFDPAGKAGDGTDLALMQARTRALAGTLARTSRPGKGNRMVLSVPRRNGR